MRVAGSAVSGLTFCFLAISPFTAVANPTIFPTGTTIYDPERAWNGYVLFSAPTGNTHLIDMNGKENGFAGKDADPLLANLGKNTELTDALIDDVLYELNADPSLAIAGSKTELKSLAKEDYDLIYFEPKGDLYVDGNGDSKGFGKISEGGMIADLPNNTILSESDVLIVV